jgi:hypothetical protein
VHLHFTDRIGRRKRSMPMPACSVSTPDVLLASMRRNVCQCIPKFQFGGIRESVQSPDSRVETTKATFMIGWIEPPEQSCWTSYWLFPV